MHIGDYYEDKDGVRHMIANVNDEEYQELNEMARTYSASSPLGTPPTPNAHNNAYFSPNNNYPVNHNYKPSTTTTPTPANTNTPASTSTVTTEPTPIRPRTLYTATAKFRYAAWVRIEDTRRIYSMSGVELSSGKKYRVELAKPLTTEEETTDALLELIDATIEFGYIAPEPCTERWVDTDNEYHLLLQHLRIDLYNLFLEHNILAHEEEKERKLIWQYLSAMSDSVDTTLPYIEELMTSYTYGMFDPEKKTKTHGRYVNKKNKKKASTKVNNSGKVKSNKKDASHATVH